MTTLRKIHHEHIGGLGDAVVHHLLTDQEEVMLHGCSDEDRDRLIGPAVQEVLARYDEPVSAMLDSWEGRRSIRIEVRGKPVNV